MKKWVSILFLGFLLLSIGGLRVLPAWSFRGLDLQNLFLFHRNCPEWPIPYFRTGAECGDPLGRKMIYPPLLYWSMGWLRWFSWPQANLIWSMAIFVFVLAGSFLVVAKEKIRENPVALWVWSLVFLQLPFVYAVERGNVDAWITLLYGAAIFSFVRGKGSISGFLVATACWMKVYPGVAAAVLLVALFSDRELRSKEFRSFLGGSMVGGVFWGLLFLGDSWVYLTDVLPAFAKERGAIQPYTHILYKDWASWVFLKIPILALWTRMSAKLLKKDPVLVLSAGLAISTFFQNTSNDYNFVTAYPFLLLYLLRFFRKDLRSGEILMLFLVFLAFVGDRVPWMLLFGNRGVLYFQILWLFIFPIWIVNRRKGERFRESET